MGVSPVFRKFAEVFARNIQNDNPVSTEGNDVYMHYDSIHIDNNSTNGVDVNFNWRGQTLFILPINTVRIENSSVIYITNVAGKTKVNISDH